jgi:hypothetical protein
LGKIESGPLAQRPRHVKLYGKMLKFSVLKETQENVEEKVDMVGAF